ncbi:MAG TPA: glucuronate isomerase [Firmicutes bacterium]|nr:glucuronate isomerase [Bacillota bacterium]
MQDLAMLKREVEKAVEEVKITDVHTHLFSPAFGELLLWGFDELVNYHYLIAETMRRQDMPYERFWALDKKEKCDLIWRTLFVENSPISEACRGVLTVLQKLGLDVGARDVAAYRDYYAGLSVGEFVDKAFALANLDCVIMTNDPFHEKERAVWLGGVDKDPRFLAALRLDGLLMSWADNYKVLQADGYEVDEGLSGKALAEVRRFLVDWIRRMDPVYMAVSLPPTFQFPEESARGKLIREAVLPVSREMNKPFAMMIGVKKRVNPGLGDAGDSTGKAAIEVVERLCADYPENKFLVTMLSRENQHELAVAARKFRNLHVFGCWWFLNNPSLIEEITRMRCELLGLGFTPQHSDARILDQVIYKWEHSRKIIAAVLFDKYADIARTGWMVTPEEIKRDVANLFGGNFWAFIER